MDAIELVGVIERTCYEGEQPDYAKMLKLFQANMDVFRSQQAREKIDFIQEQVKRIGDLEVKIGPQPELLPSLAKQNPTARRRYRDALSPFKNLGVGGPEIDRLRAQTAELILTTFYAEALYNTQSQPKPT